MTILSTIHADKLKLVLYQDGPLFGWMVMPSHLDSTCRDFALYSDHTYSKSEANSTGRHWLEYHQSMLTNISEQS